MLTTYNFHNIFEDGRMRVLTKKIKIEESFNNIYLCIHSKSLVQKYLYRNAFKSVELSTRLNKSRGGNFVIICKFVRSVATETDLKKEKIIRIEFFKSPVLTNRLKKPTC
jgi:hypothetical protein